MVTQYVKNSPRYVFSFISIISGQIGQLCPGLLVPYSGIEVSVKLIFKPLHKNFKLCILINLKRKSKYLEIIKLLAFNVPGPG